MIVTTANSCPVTQCLEFFNPPWAIIRRKEEERERKNMTIADHENIT